MWRHMLVGAVQLMAIPALTAQARDTTSQESAIGTELRDFGGFLSLDLRFGDLASEYGAFAGGEAALLFKRRVYLGIRGAGLTTDNAPVAGPEPGTSRPLQMGYGGLLIGYVIPTRDFWQVTTDVLVGAGGARPDLDGAGDDDWDGIFVFEPSLGLELKLARVARLRVGAGYRFVGGVDLTGIEDSDLRGVTGVVSLRVGWF